MLQQYIDDVRVALLRSLVQGRVAALWAPRGRRTRLASVRGLRLTYGSAVGRGDLPRGPVLRSKHAHTPSAHKPGSGWRTQSSLSLNSERFAWKRVPRGPAP